MPDGNSTPIDAVKKISRRQFLKFAVGTSATALLASCIRPENRQIPIEQLTSHEILKPLSLQLEKIENKKPVVVVNPDSKKPTYIKYTNKEKQALGIKIPPYFFSECPDWQRFFSYVSYTDNNGVDIIRPLFSVKRENFNDTLEVIFDTVDGVFSKAHPSSLQAQVANWEIEGILQNGFTLSLALVETLPEKPSQLLSRFSASALFSSPPTRIKPISA